MKIDISRETFDRSHHYASVRLQQGRVLTDADWNEQADLTRYRTERHALDVIGPCGAPEAAPAFGLSTGTSATAIAIAGARAWVAADDGLVLSTVDGGASWQVVDAGTTSHMHAIAFATASTGWIVGARGLILKTTDGGSTWTRQTAPSGVSLLGVAATSPTDAWAVGERGTVLSTSDGGTTWTETIVGSGRLYAVHFANANTGWIVGQDGQIFAKTAGANWTSQPAPGKGHLRAVAFATATVGWAVGDAGAIVRTSDGGTNWVAQTAPSTARLRALAVASGAEAWAAGDEGILLHTTDGGTTWAVEPTNTTISLRAAAFASGNSAWIVGADSTLIRTAVFSPAVALDELPKASLSFSPGRLYVHGVMCEVDERASFYHQPDREVTTRLSPGTHLLFVDVWTRDITHLVDPRIREVALGGPDTTARGKVVWQVRELAVDGGSPATWDCLSDVPGWAALIAPTTAQLKARSEPQQQVAGICEIGAAGGYRRVENQLYRIEIQDAASFKWSRENGSIAYAITSIRQDAAQNQTTIMLASRGLDENLDLATGDWVEIVDDAATLENAVGVLKYFSAEGNDALEIVVDGLLGSDIGSVASRHPMLRRWDHRPQGTAATLPIQQGLWIPLDQEGVEIWFEPGGSYRPGDYWQIPARTITGDIEWPRDEHDQPALQPPSGIEHRYCRLAFIEVGLDGTIEVLSDCRDLFPPLTAFTQLLYESGDGQDFIPGRPLPQPLQVRVVRGEHPVENARVSFQVESGGGSVAGGGSAGTYIEVSTGPDGVAACQWTLDGDPDPARRHQRVRAALLDASGTEVGGQTILFCASGSVSLTYVSGDGQEAQANTQLAYAVEVRASNAQHVASGARVLFTVVDGGGAIVGGNPASTGPDGVASVQWRLGNSGPQRVLARLLTAAGTEIEGPIAFNARVVTPQEAEGACCAITIGKNGDVSHLTSDVLKQQLEKFEGRVCLCFLSGEHDIEGLEVDGGDRARVSIHGCGAAAVVRIHARLNLSRFEFFELSNVRLLADPATGFNFEGCREVVIRGIEAEARNATEQPLFHFIQAGAVTMDACTVLAEFRGLAVVFDDVSGAVRLTSNELLGIASFYGIPPANGSFDRTALVQAIDRIEAAADQATTRVFITDNVIERLALGRRGFELLERIIGGDEPRGIALSTSFSGNTLVDPRCLYLSATISLMGTTLGRPTGDRMYTFVAGAATVSGTVTLERTTKPQVDVITPQGRCAEAANVANIQHQ